MRDIAERVEVFHLPWRLFSEKLRGGQTLFYMQSSDLVLLSYQILATLVSPLSAIKFLLAKEGRIGLKDVNKCQHRFHL